VIGLQAFLSIAYSGTVRSVIPAIREESRPMLSPNGHGAGMIRSGGRQSRYAQPDANYEARPRPRSLTPARGVRRTELRSACGNPTCYDVVLPLSAE
jgi:hypothetical protein